MLTWATFQAYWNYTPGTKHQQHFAVVEIKLVFQFFLVWKLFLLLCFAVICRLSHHPAFLKREKASNDLAAFKQQQLLYQETVQCEILWQKRKWTNPLQWRHLSKSKWRKYIAHMCVHVLRYVPSTFLESSWFRCCVELYCFNKWR